MDGYLREAPMAGNQAFLFSEYTWECDKAF